MERNRPYERAVITLDGGAVVTVPLAYHDVDLKLFVERLRAAK